MDAAEPNRCREVSQYKAWLMFRFITAFLLAFIVSFPATAGPGHDHGHDHGGATAIVEADSPRLESAGSELELVAAAEGHTLTIYLDRLKTNEPVEGATIEVSGEGIEAVSAREVTPGTYEVEAEWLDTPGSYPLVFLVTADGDMDLLDGMLEVPQPPAEEPAASMAVSELLGLPALWAVAGIAAVFGFFLSFAFRPMRLPDEPSSGTAATKPSGDGGPGVLLVVVLGATLLMSGPASEALAHEGHSHDPEPVQAGGNAPRRLPGGEVVVPKPSQRLLGVRTTIAREQNAVEGRELIGTVIADPSAAGQVQAPMDGQIELTNRGIAFVGQRVAAGEVLALLSPSMPVFDRGSLQQLTAEVEGKLIIAEQKLARLTRISGVVAQREIEDTAAELNALREQKRVLAPKSAEKLELKAPVAGVIAAASVQAGKVVSARDTLFEIVEPQRLWIEAVGIGGHDETDVTAAHALDAEGHSIALSYIGRSPALRQQSLPILFKVEDTHEELTIGTTLKVFMQGANRRKGIVLPDAAIVRGPNGLPQVWIKSAAERFEPMPVRTAALDGQNVLVTAGLEDGSRVVVTGAELINQIR